MDQWVVTTHGFPNWHHGQKISVKQTVKTFSYIVNLKFEKYETKQGIINNVMELLLTNDKVLAIVNIFY